MPFLENEDRALKAKLQGLTVTDSSAPQGGRPVDVWFRFPQKELRDVDYPFIVLDMVDVVHATEREHRNEVSLGYVPEDFQVGTATDETALRVQFPIPVWIYYTVTAYSRHPIHDRQIIAQMFGRQRFGPFRHGFLEIPEDNTIRTLDLLGNVVVGDTTDENNKTVFRKSWNIRVSAELLEEDIEEIRNVENVTLLLQLNLPDENQQANEALAP